MPRVSERESGLDGVSDGHDHVDLDYNPISCATSPDIRYHGTLRFLAALCVILGGVQLTYSIRSYIFITNIHQGAWWGVVFVILAGGVAYFGSARGWIVVASIIGGMGTLLGMTGAIGDGLSGKMFQSLNACGQPTFNGELNPAKMEYYGTPAYNWGVNRCFVAELQYHSVQTNNCYCTMVSADNSTNTCGYYELSQKSTNSGYDCGDIETHLSEMLLTSSALGTCAALSCLAMSILTCITLCCTTPKAPAAQFQGGGSLRVSLLKNERRDQANQGIWRAEE